MKSRVLMAVGSLLVGAALAMAVLPLFWMSGAPTASVEPEAELDEFFRVPPFTLTDQTGATLTLDDLKGRVWAADFMFTRCTLVCPTLSTAMKGLEQDIKRRGLENDVMLVSFSVDPGHDTVEVLRDYAAAFEADPAVWKMLTGPREAIWSLCKDGFKLTVEDTPEDPTNPITHTSRVALVDRTGMVRGYYEGLEPASMAQLAADLERLVRQDASGAR